MGYFLFIDESGYDGKYSPYAVLAGVCIEDRDLWNLLCQVRESELQYFGRRISSGPHEIKAKKLLKRKTFRLAFQLPEMDFFKRVNLARKCLEKGEASRESGASIKVTKEELTALAQAKIAFSHKLLELCSSFGVKVFASIVDKDAAESRRDFLRKDYAYLFERYFYFLEDKSERVTGFVVFDELERSKCHILIDQMSRYFRETHKGRMRASHIIPEPFFVHSDLTTAIQLADLVAYIISWGVRVGEMARPRREEMNDLAQKVCDLRYCAAREVRGREDFKIWSFAVIDDLRPREEKEDGNPLN